MSPVSELAGRNGSAGRRGATLDRRQALSLLASGVAAGLASCSKPVEQIIPYVNMPEGLTPGEAMQFATTLSLSGYGRGVIVTSIDGRPIKVEGNPKHPASLGATDVFAEASVLSLYDPDRSRTVLKNNAIASYDAFLAALQPELADMRQRQGEGLRLLTGRVTSPTMLRQIDRLLDMFPKAVWHVHDPLADIAAASGSKLAFGEPLRSVPHLEKARVLVALDGDPLGPGAGQLRNARGFAAMRQTASFSRIYSIESSLTLTGATADNRLALSPPLIGEAAIAIAHALGADIREPVLSDEARRFIKRLTDDLSANHGSTLVLAGPALAPESHALVHWINNRLHAPVDLLDDQSRTSKNRTAASLQDLTRALDAGGVSQLIIIGANPAYDAPADISFPASAAKARFHLHLGQYADETAAISTWHLPQSHELESWSDLRSYDGTASLVQPLIRPLFRSWTSHQLLALLAGQTDASAHDLVRETWQQGSDDFETWWRRALHDGVISDGSSSPVQAGQPKLPDLPPAPSKAAALALVLQPDPCVWDGSFANNAWLQECPKPLSKQVWGNALSLNSTEADRLGIAAGDVVTLKGNGREIRTPVTVEPGMADGVASLALGFGRQRAGAIGNGVGSNAYGLRSSASPWVIAEIDVTKTGTREGILTTQNIVRTPDEVRALYPSFNLKDIAAHGSDPAEPLPSLLPAVAPLSGEHAWAMVIDASLCIGCNACVVACQSENNVPVVGPEEIARGRDMHWLRVDVYDHGHNNQPRLGFQPVPCMHCEHAPCEPVCPVAASVHDSEGLNVQVYNRCVGTRFCEANCPYKVRRFNFFGYANGQEYANLGFESYRAQKNPDVTVRARGVMEKCTYCVQRISSARRAAEREDRDIGADEVRTACQNACPTQAITFGDQRNPASAVSRKKSDARHYALLEHLGTRPRTTYLADVRNPAPNLPEDAT